MIMTSTLNDRSDRIAMGLLDGFVPTAADHLGQELGSLISKTESSWLEILDDPSASIQKRWAAGTLLGLYGDGRISPTDPDMIAIDSFAAKIGLSESCVKEVCAELEAVEVLPAWIEKETPQHIVNLQRYAIGRFPVTNLEYLSFLRENPSGALPSSWEFGIFPATRANHPVYSIPIQAARQYAAWLSRKTGRHFRLPTEAEWEFAAAGPQTYEYPWGRDWSVGRANTAELGLYQSTPVGMFPSGRSWCGALDMAGNVEEFTADVYQPYPGGRFIADDLYRTLGPYPIARGGSFTRFYDLARCKRRHGAYPKSIYVLGFRLAETLA